MEKAILAMTTQQPNLFEQDSTPEPEEKLQRWQRAKALGDIGRHLAAAYNDNGQVSVILYNWQRDLITDELIRIEAIEAKRLNNLVLGSDAALRAREAGPG